MSSRNRAKTGANEMAETHELRWVLVPPHDQPADDGVADRQVGAHLAVEVERPHRRRASRRLSRSIRSSTSAARTPRSGTRRGRSPWTGRRAGPAPGSCIGHRLDDHDRAPAGSQAGRPRPTCAPDHLDGTAGVPDVDEARCPRRRSAAGVRGSSMARCARITTIGVEGLEQPAVPIALVGPAGRALSPGSGCRASHGQFGATATDNLSFRCSRQLQQHRQVHAGVAVAHDQQVRAASLDDRAGRGVGRGALREGRPLVLLHAAPVELVRDRVRRTDRDPAATVTEPDAVSSALTVGQHEQAEDDAGRQPGRDHRHPPGLEPAGLSDGQLEQLVAQRRQSGRDEDRDQRRWPAGRLEAAGGDDDHRPVPQVGAVGDPAEVHERPAVDSAPSNDSLCGPPPGRRSARRWTR